MGGAGVSDDELPIHAVTISAFDLDAYEVTVADFRSFRVGYEPSEYSACEQCERVLGRSGRILSLHWQTAPDRGRI